MNRGRESSSLHPTNRPDVAGEGQAGPKEGSGAGDRAAKSNQSSTAGSNANAGQNGSPIKDVPEDPKNAQADERRAAKDDEEIQNSRAKNQNQNKPADAAPRHPRNEIPADLRLRESFDPRDPHPNQPRHQKQAADRANGAQDQGIRAQDNRAEKRDRAHKVGRVETLDRAIETFQGA